uniref:EF-hand and coiled-coil domain-containing protein 1-like n=1 Tax=Saccoglossus kowalevskii TaxID=10224 RepID=A0ABM0MU32_SACKO|nr:PREDICTED: EF-hand and coiled-coil domain-containing protein 1-like [Saccoglossus kowalevskii]
MERSESYIFPARRAQWIVSALAYNYGLDRGVENEIVVLAAGLDQYLQEIYHHLDSNGDQKLPCQDFKVLCEILGLLGDGENDIGNSVILFKNLPEELDFKEFHMRLGEYFASRGDKAYKAVPECTHDTEHIDTELRLRHPRTGLTLHTMCVECFSSKPITDIYKSLLHVQGREDNTENSEANSKESGVKEPAQGSNERTLGDQVRELKRELVKSHEENESLREVVEDMRLALQSNDARSLALQVAFRKTHLLHEKCEVKKTKYRTRSPLTQSKSIEALVQELNHLRESRDNQLEEAMRFTQQLEADLLRSRRELLELEYNNNVLTTNQRAMYQELEKTRKTVSESLSKVRCLEGRARQNAETQQCKILELEQRLAPCTSASESNIEETDTGCKENDDNVSDQSERISPAGDSDTSGGDNQSESSISSEEQLFRAVEGRAASDEESQWQENKHEDDYKQIDDDDEEEEQEDEEDNYITMEKMRIRIEELTEQVQQMEDARLAAEEETEGVCATHPSPLISEITNKFRTKKHKSLSELNIKTITIPLKVLYIRKTKGFGF